MIGVRLQPDLLNALDRAIEPKNGLNAIEPKNGLTHLTRPEAIRAILRDWLTTHGHLPR